MAQRIVSFCFLLLLLLVVEGRKSENYEYYCVGNCENKIQTPTQAGTVLMGGSTDVDAAFMWMIDRCGGGDFLVLRATGSDGYNQYIYDMGGVNSVSTLVLLNRDASFDSFVYDTILNSEALFFAGGDQWKYYSYWKDSPVQDAITTLMNNSVPIGGTSAGNAIQPQYVYTAEFDTIISKEALSDPYHYRLTIGTNFISNKYLENVITDTHFEARDRMGRFITFVARLMRDVWSSPLASGIAVDEKTALLIDADGMASLTSWTDHGSAYLLLPDHPAEVCEPSEDLMWSSIDVFRLRGNTSNAYSFATGTKYDVEGTLSYQLSVKNGKITSTQSGGAVY